MQSNLRPTDGYKRQDKARAGKMALTMKELQEMEVGDFSVHVDLSLIHISIASFSSAISTPAIV